MIRRALRMTVTIGIIAIVVVRRRLGRACAVVRRTRFARARRENGRRLALSASFWQHSSDPFGEGLCCPAACSCCRSLVGMDSPEQYPRLVPRGRSHGARSFSRVNGDDPEREGF